MKPKQFIIVSLGMTFTFLFLLVYGVAKIKAPQIIYGNKIVFYVGGFILTILTLIVTTTKHNAHSLFLKLLPLIICYTYINCRIGLQMFYDGVPIENSFRPIFQTYLIL